MGDDWAAPTAKCWEGEQTLVQFTPELHPFITKKSVLSLSLNPIQKWFWKTMVPFR